MKTNWDSIKFITKVVALVIVLIAGYAKKTQSNSPAKKGAVDLIRDQNVEHGGTLQHVESSKEISV